jgi:hypothetical protein
MAVISAYAHKIAKVTISGTCFGGSEVWSTGFFMGSPTVDVSGVNSPGSQNIAAAWQTFFTNTDAWIPNSYKTVQVKTALINQDGTTDLDEIDYYTYPAPISGGGVGNPLPPQLTVAATLTSDNQRGLAAKGRMYLPGVSIGVTSASAKIASTQMGLLTDRFKTFLDAVNTAAGTSGKIILASKGRRQANQVDGNTIYIGGQSAWVTGCRIGDVYDTQRRRRNQIPETYTARVLAP